MIDFGDRVYNLRVKLSITQAELAVRLKTSKRSVGAWEKNKVAPRAVLIGRLEELEKSTGIAVVTVMRINNDENTIDAYAINRRACVTARKLLLKKIKALNDSIFQYDKLIKNL